VPNQLTKQSAKLRAACGFVCAVALLTSAFGANPSYAFAQSAPAQDGWTAIKTDDGILFIWNLKDLSFTLSLKGREIKPLNEPEHIFFEVDGLVFQIQLASINEFAPDARKQKLDDKLILAAHRDWEAKFLEGLLNTKLNVQSVNLRLANDRDALLWHFDMPEGMNADAKRQMYLAVVGNNYVLLLNGVVTATAPEATVRKLRSDTMTTLKISPERIDVLKLQEAIRKGNKP
jgi:hypothetical protein